MDDAESLKRKRAQVSPDLHPAHMRFCEIDDLAFLLLEFCCFSTQVARACQRCASAKRRCSGTFPCERCIHLGAQDSCIEVRVKKKGTLAPPRGGGMPGDEFDETYEDDADRRVPKRRTRPGAGAGVGGRRGYDEGGSVSDDGHTGMSPRMDQLYAGGGLAVHAPGLMLAPAFTPFSHQQLRAAPPPPAPRHALVEEAAMGGGGAGAVGDDVFAGVDLLLRASGEGSSAAAAAARSAAAARGDPAAAAADSYEDGGGAGGDSSAPQPGSAHIPLAPPDIGITAESDLQSLMPYPAWRIVYATTGGAVDERRLWAGTFPLQGVAANAAGCDLFNVAAEDLPYLARRCRSIVWLHPDDIAGRSAAAAEVRQLRRRYYGECEAWRGTAAWRGVAVAPHLRTQPTLDPTRYPPPCPCPCPSAEWSGRYIRVVPSAAAGPSPAAAAPPPPPPTYQLFFAVERIFVAYGASGAARQVLSVFSMVRDSGLVLPPEVYERAVRAAAAPPGAILGSVAAMAAAVGGGVDAALLPWPRLAPGAAAAAGAGALGVGRRGVSSRASSMDSTGSAVGPAGYRTTAPHPDHHPAASAGLGSAWTASGTHHGGGRSFNELMPPLPPAPALGPPAAAYQRGGAGSGGARMSRDGSDLAERLLSGGATQWLPDAGSYAGGGGVGMPAPPAVVASSGGGRYSFSEVLRGLSGDWTGEPVAASPPAGTAGGGAAASAGREEGGRGASFGMMADDALPPMAPMPPPGEAAEAAVMRALPNGSSFSRRASSSGTLGILSPTSAGGGGLRSSSFGVGSGDPFGVTSPSAALAGGAEGRLPAGHSWATDMAMRTALAAAAAGPGIADPLAMGPRVSIATRGVSDGSLGLSVGPGVGADVDAGGRLWGEDTADGAGYAGGGGDRDSDRGGSRGSADFTYGFPSLGLGGGGPRGGGGAGGPEHPA